MDRHLQALVHARLVPHPGPARHPQADDLPGGGQEPVVRVLGVDPALHGVAVQLDVLLAEGQGVAGRAADHLLAQVDAGDHLGDRVLHLQPGVHLQEEEFPGLAGDDELHRAGRIVVHRPGRQDRLLAHAPAHVRVREGGGGLLDHLLVPALDRALPLGEVDQVAVAVAQELDLHVAGMLDVALQVDGVVAEGVQALGLGGPVGGRQVLGAEHHAQALAAAPGGRLEHHRVADLLGPGHGMLLGLQVLAHARHQGHPHGVHRHPGGGLVAHDPDRLRVGPDEGDPGCVRRPRRTPPARTGTRSPGGRRRRRCAGPPPAPCPPSRYDSRLGAGPMQ